MAGKQLLKYTEWQSAGTGRWYCTDISGLSSVRSKWWVPARMLNISVPEFVELLINEYKVDNITLNNGFLNYSWNSEHHSDAHRFVLYINRMARQRNYVV